MATERVESAGGIAGGIGEVSSGSEAVLAAHHVGDDTAFTLWSGVPVETNNLLDRAPDRVGGSR